MTTAPPTALDPADVLARYAEVYEAPPDGLSPDALDLWHRHLAMLAGEDVMPDPAQHRLLADACRAATTADSLAAALAAEGTYTVPGGRGAPRPHPLLLEIDRARRTTAALLKQLTAASRAESSRANGASRWQR